MAPVWSALIGALAALIGVWVTQALTNRREFRRDQLRWAQERQQRQVDLQRTVFLEALTVLNGWHRSLRAVALWLEFPDEAKPDAIMLDEHLERANSELTAVELVCSDAATLATRHAVSALSRFYYQAYEAARETEIKRASVRNWCVSPPIDISYVRNAMSKLHEVYRAELAKLDDEPVVLPRESRSRLRLPWRKSS